MDKDLIKRINELAKKKKILQNLVYEIMALNARHVVNRIKVQ